VIRENKCPMQSPKVLNGGRSLKKRERKKAFGVGRGRQK
jgi:hypothetical protein